MPTITKQGFIATSGFLPAYGGIILAREPMYEIAKAVREGKIPMHAQHDERKTLNPNILVVDVRETDSGELGVWVEFEIDEQEWEKYGDLRAFSVSLVANPFQPDLADNKPPLNIYADVGHFDDDAYQSTVELLSQHFAVGGGRLLQFSIEPLPKLIIEIAANIFQSVPANLFSSWLFEALKSKLLVLKGNREPEQIQDTITCLRIRGEHQNVDLLQVQTHNSDTLEKALTTFYENVSLEPKGRVFEFDDKSQKWKLLQ